MRTVTVVTSALLVLLLTSPAAAQQESPASPDAPGPRRATLAGGLGNSMGGFGLQGTWYFQGDRLSAFGGLGYLPVDESSLAFAAGIRGFTPGENHRGFLELSLLPVGVQTTTSVSSGLVFSRDELLYGPGLQAGYQYVADGGFTVMASAGFGYGLGADEGLDEEPVALLINLELGYTWR